MSPNLTINTETTTHILVRFLQAELGKAGFSRAVLGLSGGLDSALVAYLAAQALGGANVLALRLPYRTSAPASLEHADLVINQLGLQQETLDITPLVEPLFTLTPDMTPLRRGNVMARARMLVAYDRSAAFGGLVLGTSNKSELLLGYGTIFGDLAHALNPIGDLYKTQVRQLAHALGVPQVILTKPPSADLAPNQTDEGDFGFTYAIADQILYLLVDERYTPDEVVAAGLPRPVVERVVTLVQRNQYKRVMPLIPRLSNRTLGHDFLYLRDWGQ